MHKSEISTYFLKKGGFRFGSEWFAVEKAREITQSEVRTKKIEKNTFKAL